MAEWCCNWNTPTQTVKFLENVLKKTIACCQSIQGVAIQTSNLSHKLDGVGPVYNRLSTD